jgi:hypothetical protein
MGNTRQLFASATKRLLAGFLLVGLLGGCEPLVKVTVQVDTCQAGGMGRQFGDIDGVGACTTPFISWAGKSADGFYNSQTGNLIPSGSGLTCASGVKCQASPGNCGIGKPCKSWYRPSNQSCICDCNRPAP